VGGVLPPQNRGYYSIIICYLFYFSCYANPLPFRSLNLHNRQVDDHGAGEDEVLLEGVDAGMVEAEETEEMGQNLLVSVVLKKQSTIKNELRKIGGGAWCMCDRDNYDDETRVKKNTTTNRTQWENVKAI